jgi:hypothetical protein
VTVVAAAVRDHVKALDDVGGARTIGPLVRSEVLLQAYVRRWTEPEAVAEDRVGGNAHDGRPRRGIGDMRWNRFLAILLGLITVLLTAGIAVMLSPGDEAPQDSSGNTEPAAAAPPSPTHASPSDPVPASSSAALVSSSANPTVVAAFAGEAEKLRDELKEHHVPFNETDVTAIVAIGEEAVARNVPDLSADDPAITERVNQTFPHYTPKQRKVVVRCVAEQVEQVIARQASDGIPPDQRGRPGG